MPGMEASSLTDTAFFDFPKQEDTVGDKLTREAMVIATGVADGIADGARQSWEDPAGTGARLGISFGVGVIIGLAQRSAGLARLAGEAAAAGLALGTATDMLMPDRWSAVGDALADTWDSPAQTDRNISILSDNLGRFTFDSWLSMAGSMAGAKVGQAFMLQLNPGISSQLSRNLSQLDLEHNLPSNRNDAVWPGTGIQIKTMPMLAMDYAAIESAAAGVKPVIVRVSVPTGPVPDVPSFPVRPAGSNLAISPEAAKADVADQGVVASKSPVTSMPAVTGITERPDGTVVLDLADGTQVTTRKSGS